MFSFHLIIPFRSEDKSKFFFAKRRKKILLLATFITFTSRVSRVHLFTGHFAQLRENTTFFPESISIQTYCFNLQLLKYPFEAPHKRTIMYNCHYMLYICRSKKTTYLTIFTILLSKIRIPIYCLFTLKMMICISNKTFSVLHKYDRERSKFRCFE